MTDLIILFIGTFVICALPVSLYLIAKKYPKFSRELHKTNCHCTVCYPDDGVKQ